MLIKRRQFIQAGSLATASFLVPKFLKAFERPGTPPGEKILVVLQLSGGNDGLNTVIPVRNDIYYQVRPQLGILRSRAPMLTDDAALHPSLSGLKALYDDGSLGILSSVGYPNPDRSHFRSMDIWHTASDSKQYLHTGWLGRYLDAQCNGCDKPTQVLEIDDVVSLALKGEQIKGMALRDPRRLYNASRDSYFTDLLHDYQMTGDGSSLDFLYKTMAETVSSANYIFEQSQQKPTTATYPDTELGKNLKTIASLIFSDINTRVYYLSLGSFDTHVNQAAQQERLFGQLNDAILAFTADLKANHRFEDVLLMTFSEFGRRVAQNASGGTDHGTANMMFMVSGGLRQKGLINPLPDLRDLQEGDLKYKVDFRDVYGTILRNWLGAEDKKILSRSSAYLGFI